MPVYNRRAHRIAQPRRLIRCMQWSACLSDGEAASALRDWRDGFTTSGEAVNHYGGINAVLQAAINSRDVVRRFDTGYRNMRDENYVQ